jgi:hypothetical protein
LIPPNIGTTEYTEDTELYSTPFSAHSVHSVVRFSFPDKGRIGFEVAAQVTCEQLGLHVGDRIRSSGGIFKVLGLDLATVDEGEHKAVGQERTEFFHEVKRERGPTGPVGVEVADARVEANAFEGGAAVVNQQGVGEREQCVDRVGGRTAVTTAE